jgi:hypothetical protein
MIKKTAIIISSFLALSSTLFADEMADKIKVQNQEVVKLAAKELSSQLPQKIDNFTQLMNIEAKDETLIYTFEINATNKSDDMIIKEDRSRMKKAITEGICNSSKKFLENGIDISYTYTSAKSKKELFRFDVSQKDCVKK